VHVLCICQVQIRLQSCMNACVPQNGIRLKAFPWLSIPQQSRPVVSCYHNVKQSRADYREGHRDLLGFFSLSRYICSVGISLVQTWVPVCRMSDGMIYYFCPQDLRISHLDHGKFTVLIITIIPNIYFPCLLVAILKTR
jgi:hypothetical protein